MALDKLIKIDGGGISTTSDYRVGVITATKFVGPIEGSITATDATFSGNVSIAGTLTYEDVTNIDSVGIITAQGDIHVGAGVSAVGVGTFGSLDISGDIDVDGHTNLDNVSVAGVTTFSDDVKFTGANYNVLWDKSDNSLKFDALAKIKLNDSFQFYHNTNGVLHNTSGTTYIYGSGSGAISLMAQAGSQNISCNPNSNTSLYYANSQKLYTVSDGVFINDNLGIQDSIKHILDTNTKIRFPAADTVSIETAGSERLRITSAGHIGFNRSNVDINDTSSQQAVVEPSRFVFNNNYSNNYTDASLKLYLFMYGATRQGFTSGPNYDLQYHSSGNATHAKHSFFTQNTERLRITAGGRILIATTTEGHSNADDLTIATAAGSLGNTGITIRSSTTGDGNIFFSDATSGDGETKGVIKYAHNTDHMQFNTAGSERLRITSSGHVVPGTDSTYDLGLTGTRFRNVYADTLYGDGSNLTGITQTTINNNADNRVITGSGTANTLEAESTLTYDGNTLQNLQSGAAANLTLKATSNSFNSLILDSNRSADTQFAIIDGRWNGNPVARIQFVTGSDGTNKDDGYMVFHTRTSGASLAERLRITSSGLLKVNSTDGSAWHTIRLNTTTNNAIKDVLHVHSSVDGATAAAGYGVRLNFSGEQLNGNEYTYGGIAGLLSSVGSTYGDLAFYTNNNGTLGERLRITSSGVIKFTGQTTSFENAGLTHHTNNNLYIRGGSSGAILQSADANEAWIVQNSYVSASTNGNEAFRIDSGQRYLQGVTTNTPVCSVAGAKLQVHNNASVITASFTGYGAHAGGSVIALGKSRSNTIGDATGAVSNGDTLGDIRFGGSDGTDMHNTAAAIRGEVDGSVSSNSLPGRLEFDTNSGSGNSIRLTIDSSGRLLVNGAISNNAFAGGDDLIIGNTSSGTRSGITLVSNSSEDGGLYFSDGTSSGNAHVQGQIVYDHSGNYMRFYTSATERLRIDTNGRLTLYNSEGIKLSAKTSSLFATDGSLSYYASNNAVYLNGAGASGWLRLNASGFNNNRTAINLYGHSYSTPDRIDFRTNTSERIRIESDGGTIISNAGSFPTSTSETLTIQGEGHNGHGTTNTRSVFNITAAMTSRPGNGGGGLWIGARTNEDTAVIGTRTANGNLAFETYSGGWSEKMRLRSDGKVLMGTGLPTSGYTNSILHVEGPGVDLRTDYDTDDNQGLSPHLTLFGSNAHVRLDMGTQDVGPYASYIQSRYDNDPEDSGTSNSGLEPLMLNPMGGPIGFNITTSNSYSGNNWTGSTSSYGGILMRAGRANTSTVNNTNTAIKIYPAETRNATTGDQNQGTKYGGIAWHGLDPHHNNGSWSNNYTGHHCWMGMSYHSTPGQEKSNWQVQMNSSETPGSFATNVAIQANPQGYVTHPNQPYASTTLANASAGQMIPHNTVYANNGGHFNTSNSRFICPVNGFYLVSIMVMSNNSNTTMDIELRKNGSNANNILVPYQASTGGSYNQVSGTTIIECAKNDYLQFRCGNGSIYSGRHSAQCFALLG